MRLNVFIFIKMKGINIKNICSKNQKKLLVGLNKVKI